MNNPVKLIVYAVLGLVALGIVIVSVSYTHLTLPTTERV